VDRKASLQERGGSPLLVLFPCLSLLRRTSKHFAGRYPGQLVAAFFFFFLVDGKHREKEFSRKEKFKKQTS
jgi:hypothetical protein